MKSFLSLLALFLIVLLVGSICLAIIVGWSVGGGWLLTQILPFTLFEGTLLTMVASIVVGFVAAKIFLMGDSLSSPYSISPDDFLEDVEPELIPEKRFYDSKGRRTNEAWFRWDIANSMYFDFEDDDDINTTMNDVEMQELAVRLSEITVAAMKKYRTRPGKRVRVTISQLKRQMDKMGQRPYDDDILATAVAAINRSFDYDDDFAEIIRDKSWNKLAEDW
ncbi:MAG: hypothetical protein GY796_14990 [Chloroflexi bacterium]|nr:hypothetical protein [Chloroflexota bacterium]